VRDGHVGAVEIIWCEGEIPMVGLGVKGDEEAPDRDLPPGHMTFLREIPRS
jgi:hypothetical protein